MAGAQTQQEYLDMIQRGINPYTGMPENQGPMQGLQAAQPRSPLGPMVDNGGQATHDGSNGTSYGGHLPGWGSPPSPTGNMPIEGRGGVPPVPSPSTPPRGPGTPIPVSGPGSMGDPNVPDPNFPGGVSRSATPPPLGPMTLNPGQPGYTPPSSPSQPASPYDPTHPHNAQNMDEQTWMLQNGYNPYTGLKQTFTPANTDPQHTPPPPTGAGGGPSNTPTNPGPGNTAPGGVPQLPGTTPSTATPGTGMGNGSSQGGNAVAGLQGAFPGVPEQNPANMTRRSQGRAWSTNSGGNAASGGLGKLRY